MRRLREHVHRPHAPQPVSGPATSWAAFGASVVGLQDTYTIRRGAGLDDPPHDLLREARAGRIDDQHVGPAGALDQFAQRQADVAGEEVSVVDLVADVAFAIASAIASSTISRPHTSAARGAISRPIVPIPQYRS